jgi:RES domain
MTGMAMAQQLAASQRLVRWSRATRIIASRYPPIDLFERVSSDPQVWEALIAAEQRVNPQVRDAVGEIHLVAPAERVAGPGASYVMASFTHVNPRGSRFAGPRAGAYYAGRELETALRETAYHFARFAADSNDPPRYETMRVLVGKITVRFHDVAVLAEPERAAILDPDDYSASQAYAQKLRDTGANGIVYPSVRNPGGQCIAAFRPKAVGIPVQTKHLRYHWDGKRVGRYFDHSDDTWRAVWAD